MNNKKIILASNSAGRLDILKKMLIIPDEIIVSNIPEPIIKHEKPKDMSIRLAKDKAQAVLKMYLEKYKNDENAKNAIIIAGDTVACKGNRVLDKALTDDDVKKYLNIMKGKNSRIYSTACIIDVATGRMAVKTGEARVKMKHLQQDEIDFYIKTKQGIGKAGGYGIGLFACCIFEKIVGDFYSIIGLPANKVYNTLRSFGYKFDCENFEK